MARFADREQAIILRKAGNSYSQIKSVLGVGKGTLSAWLSDFPLSEARIRELRDWSQQRIERYRETRRKKREALLAESYSQAKSKIFPISKRDFYIAGLFLYWGEGGKTKLNELILSNTNPAVVVAFIRWLETVWEVDRSKLRIRMHFYKDMNPSNEISVWSKMLNIPVSQFTKPYIKQSNFSSLTYKRGFGHGTCNVAYANARVAREVLMGLKSIEDYLMGQ